MKRLTEVLGNTSDDRIKRLVNAISDNNIDIHITDTMQKTFDSEIDNELDKLSIAFDNIVSLLHKKGYINQHGYKITLKNNI